MQAVNRLTQKAVNVRSEARDAYRNYRSAYDIAGHYQREVLPLRKIISDEMLLRYNAMQIDVFALLAEAQQTHRRQRGGDRGAARFLARKHRSFDGRWSAAARTPREASNVASPDRRRRGRPLTLMRRQP